MIRQYLNDKNNKKEPKISYEKRSDEVKRKKKDNGKNKKDEKVDE